MSDIEDLIIDPEFESLILPLDPKEYKELESSILSEGAVISAIVVWKGEGIIVDGHHRYKIIKDHPGMDIHYEIYEKEFPDRYAVQAWMCSNQLGRRNLTPEQKKYLIGKQYEAEKASHGGDREMVRDENGWFTASGQIDHLPSKTRERIANETQTSDSYVKRAEKYAQGVDLADELVPGTRQEILSGSIKPTDKAMSEFLKADDPDDRKKLIEGFHEGRRSSQPASSSGTTMSDKLHSDSAKVSDEDTADIVHDKEDNPATYITLKHAKEAADSLNTTSGEETEDDVIYELNDALESLMFRWNFAVEANPHAVKGSSYRCRRDELISRAHRFLDDFEQQDH